MPVLASLIELRVDRRLVLEDVEAGAGERVRLQALDQRRLVDDRAARRVHDDGARAHQLQPAAREEVVGGGRRRAVHRDDVDARQHLVEAVPVGRLELLLGPRARPGGGCGSGWRGRRRARAARPRCRSAPCRRCRGACPRCGGRASRSATSRPISALRAGCAAPSASRRGTERISAIVMSAVSSVSTFGVLVTVMPRFTAASTSMLSTPLPKLAISFSRSPACAIIARVDPVGDGRHEHVGRASSPRPARPASSACRRC